jgi:hypothetical protein
MKGQLWFQFFFRIAMILLWRDGDAGSKNYFSRDYGGLSVRDGLGVDDPVHDGSTSRTLSHVWS